MGLTFLPRPPQPRPKKRSRAVADIDGEHSCTQKKKRRLRLFLITSRLSPQYSHPATNIVNRGSSKIAVWAKQKALGRNLLRKAAILNDIRRRSFFARQVDGGRGRVLVEQEKEEAQLELARLEFNHGSVDTYTRPVHTQTHSVPPSAAVRTGGHFVVSGSPSTSPTPSRSPSPTPPSPSQRRSSDEEASTYRSPNEAYAYSPPRAQIPRRDYLPLPPSPLGLSNYDAFDIEDGASDPYAHLDDDEDDEPIPNPFDDDDDDDVVPFSPSAITTNSSMTVQTGTTQALPTPPTVYSDFNMLDHGEPVTGDLNQIDEGVDAAWPSAFGPEAPASVLASTSPDFPALFATTSPSSSKRTDSFATSPNFRPRLLAKSISPNFAPSPLSTFTSLSPNFTPSTATASLASPSITSTTSSTSSISPNVVPVTTSPNFAAIDVLTTPHSLPTATASHEISNEGVARKQSDIEQERKRQRDLMFMRFGS